MRPTLILITVAFLATVLPPVRAAEPAPPARKPEQLRMALVMVADTRPTEYLFVVNDVIAFKTVDSLKRYVGSVPPGSTLTWGPGCCRIGGEPLLSNPKDLDAFKAFCKEKRVTLVIIPAG